MAFTEEQLLILTNVNVACAAVSFAGAIFVIICFCYFKTSRTFAFKLVLMLAVSDAGYSMGYFLHDPMEGTILCYVQSLVLSFFNIASVLWTLCIAITLFLIVVRHRTDVERYHVAYHVLCWGVAGILTGLPFITDSYGDSGSWCWIKGDEQGTIWRFVQFYLILWIVLLVIMVLYLLIGVEVRRSVSQLTHTTGGSTLLRLGLYPIILFVSYAFASANRIQNFVWPDHEIFWLFVLHTVFSSLVGLFNALAYVATHVLRRETASLCRRMCCCCCAREGDDHTETSPLLTEHAAAIANMNIVPINLNLSMPVSPHWVATAAEPTQQQQQ